jgi:alpha-D-xyloside xylohydrolase
MFGSNLLVAPLMEETPGRRVYLPPGMWIDYQTGRAYEGARWHEITAGPIPIVVLVKNHTVLPHLAIAQSTSMMNWNDVQLRVFSTDGGTSTGSFALPSGNVLPLRVDAMRLVSDPLAGKVKWRVTH